MLNIFTRKFSKKHWDDYSSLQAGVILSPAQLHILQQILTEMLHNIVDVCEKNHIPYFLVGGTALGALRHGGFIPWDDDIDIAMFRKDYERFLICFEEELKDKYYIQTPEHTDGYPSLIPRIRSMGTVVRSREDLWTDESHSGAWVDLFVFENTFDNSFLRFFHGLLCLGSGGLLACRKVFHMRKKLRPFVIPESAYARKVLLRSIIGGFFAWLPINWIRKFANNCNRMCKNDQCLMVTAPSGHWRFFGDMYPRAFFANGRKENFAGMQCQVPLKVEKYLEHCYGTWQQIPENAEKERHFFCAFSLEKAEDCAQLRRGDVIK